LPRSVKGALGPGSWQPCKIVDALLRRPLTRPGSDIDGDVVEWFETRAEAEPFIAGVASEPKPEEAVLAAKLSVVEVEFETAPN
jgi:hypothetical protein